MDVSTMFHLTYSNPAKRIFSFFLSYIFRLQGTSRLWRNCKFSK